MQDIMSMITGLRRPRLLVSAARFGLGNYRRGAQLGRLLGSAESFAHGPAAMQLLSIEADLNDKRTRRAADYSIARHVDVLAALMAEAQALRQQATSPTAIT